MESGPYVKAERGGAKRGGKEGVNITAESVLGWRVSVMKKSNTIELSGHPRACASTPRAAEHTTQGRTRKHNNLDWFHKYVHSIHN